MGLIAKLAPAGALLWTRTFEGSTNSTTHKINGLAVDPSNGGVVGIGTMANSTSDIFVVCSKDARDFLN